MTQITNLTTDSIGMMVQNLINVNTNPAGAKTAVATAITNAKTDGDKQLWIQVQENLNTQNLPNANPTYSNTYSNLITYPNTN